MAPCTVAVGVTLTFVLLVQTSWAQPTERKDHPEVNHENNETVRETEIEVPIDKEILNQFKKHAIANSKVLLELGKQQLRLLSYLSGRKRGGDLLFGAIEEEILNMLPTAPGTPPLSDNSPDEELKLSKPPHGIGSLILAQNTGSQIPLVSQQAALPVPPQPAVMPNAGNQVPLVSQQAALPVPPQPAVMLNAGNQVPLVSQQAALPVPPQPAIMPNAGNQVPLVSQQAALPVPPQPAVMPNAGNQVSLVSQQAAPPVPPQPAVMLNAGNQVPLVSQQAALSVPAQPAVMPNAGNQVPLVSQQAALSVPPEPAVMANAGNQVYNSLTTPQNQYIASGTSPSTNTSPDIITLNQPALYPSSYPSAAPTYDLKPPSKPFNPLTGDAFHHSFDSITLPALKPVYI